MKVTFNLVTKTLWHSDCELGDHSPPMIEVEHHIEEERSTLECSRCEKRCYYPHGGGGTVEVDEFEPMPVDFTIVDD